MRPLQLPTCFRRLFGKIVVRWLAPEIEPRLSPDQAAVRGGHCGINIRQAFRHLASDHEAPPPAGDLWWMIMGPAGPYVDRLAGAVDGSPLARCAADFFADQSKAFERVSVAWFARVLAGWRLPVWVQRAMLSLVHGRAVQALVGGRPGPRHDLARSLGLGGTAAPLSWNMSYDILDRRPALVLGR